MPSVPCTIFVAEDHEMLSDLVIALLQKVPVFRVIGSAKDGRTAFEQCTLLKPRLLILDLELPVLNGIEVINRLVDSSPDTHILLFTGSTDPALLRAAVAAGVSGIVHKTEPVEKFIAAINTVAAGHSFFEASTLQLLQAATIASGSRCALTDLTGRELDVFRLVAQGRSNKEAARELGISVKTVETHRKNLMQKLDAKNTADLTREAFRLCVLTG